MRIDVTTREISADVFGNEKFVEVVLAFENSAPRHAQDIARELNVDGNVVRPVLRRLAQAGLLVEHPRSSKRAALHYSPQPNHRAWQALTTLCHALHVTDTLF